LVGADSNLRIDRDRPYRVSRLVARRSRFPRNENPATVAELPRYEGYYARCGGEQGVKQGGTASRLVTFTRGPLKGFGMNRHFSRRYREINCNIVEDKRIQMCVLSRSLARSLKILIFSWGK